MTGRHRAQRGLRWRSLRAALAAFGGMGYAGRHRAADVPMPLPTPLPTPLAERTPVPASVATAS